MKKFFATRPLAKDIDLVLLLFRVICGYAFMLHGWGKIQNPFVWMGPDSTVPGVLQALAALAEFGGGLAWILGLVTPLSSIGIGCTMAVAIYMHAVVMGDPFVSKGGGSFEPATMFLLISLLLFVLGPGRFSVDRKIFGVK